MSAHLPQTNTEHAAEERIRDIRTADNRLVGVGDRVFNYYDGHWGVIATEPDNDGWFDVVDHLSGRRMYLNGERICVVIPPGNPFFRSHGDGNLSRT